MVLVTGSTGLLGSHVILNLLLEGYEVKALYRSERKKDHFLHLAKHILSAEQVSLLEQISWVKGDILDVASLEEAMQGCNQVIHCAALVSFHRRDFNKLFKINREGTANVVNVALGHHVEHFIQVSSTAAVGKSVDQDELPVVESNSWNQDATVSGYSLSKYSAEKEVYRAHEEGLPMSIVNPSIMFGPGDWNESSLKIFRTLQEGLRFYTTGANAFVDVRDVAKAIVLILKAGPQNDRFLVTGTNKDFKTLFELISDEMHVKPHRFLAGPKLTDVAWRLSGLFARLYGRRPTLTKESARSSQAKVNYSSDKLLKRFPAFQFRSLDETIRDTVSMRMDS
jgi:nucleoside-diphosphate-sugar epimerase